MIDKKTINEISILIGGLDCDLEEPKSILNLSVEIDEGVHCFIRRRLNETINDLNAISDTLAPKPSSVVEAKCADPLAEQASEAEPIDQDTPEVGEWYRIDYDHVSAHIKTGGVYEVDQVDDDGYFWILPGNGLYHELVSKSHIACGQATKVPAPE